jgi:Protein of unknown function (DUF1091)
VRFRLAVLKLDNFSIQVDERYMSSKYTYTDTSDGNGFVVNGEDTLKLDMEKVQQSITLSTPESINDKEYSHIFTTVTVDLCKLSTVQPNIIVRVLLQIFLNFSNSKIELICPPPKNAPLKITNLTITDQFFPPMSFETKFKLNLAIYATIKDRKRWIFLYSHELLMRYEK